MIFYFTGTGNSLYIVRQIEETPSWTAGDNRWLADNCFGDYYTRNGLNDQERELITF